MQCLEPIWSSKPATARRLLQRLSVVFKWAVASGLRESDPTVGVAEALPRQNGMAKHHRAPPHRDVAAAIRTVRASTAPPAGRSAFEFLVLTAVRWGEVRSADWAEVDLGNAVWTVPPERSKTKRAHRVPLSTRAVELLREAGPRHGGLIFQTNGQVLGDRTLRTALENLRISGAPHGFRASFRSWCAETGVAREVAETTLAHVAPGIESAYQRSDLLEARRELMERWADYLAGD